MNHIKKYINQISRSRTTKKVSRDNIAINCPFCSDSTFNMWIGLKVPAYHCWKCNSSGHISKLSKLLNIYITDDYDFLYELEDDSGETVYQSIKNDFSKIELPEGTIPLYDNFNSKSIILNKAISYLCNRGIDFEKIKKYKLGFCSSGEYVGRIIVPVYDADGDLSWFLGRSIYPLAALKVLNPRKEQYGVGKSDVLFNIQNNVDKDTVIINEGVFDAMSTDGVAIFGKVLSEYQLWAIKNLPASNIIVMLDNDAIDYAWEIAEILWHFKNVFVCELPYGKDPNDLTKGELEKVLNEKIKFSEYHYLKKKLG